MATVNRYRVTFQRQDYESHASIRDSRVELAYSAQDARYQVEITFEGSEPRDPYLRVLRIEPLHESEQR